MRFSQSKYHNIKTSVGGIEFDSALEAKRWKQLELLQRAGVISSLERQVRFEILPKLGKHRAKFYVADFTYRDKEGNLVVEDTKGVLTDVFRLKEHLMLYRYGIEIKLIRKEDV